jgi:hypothetical protein
MQSGELPLRPYGLPMIREAVTWGFTPHVVISASFGAFFHQLPIMVLLNTPSPVIQKEPRCPTLAAVPA